MLTLVIYLYVYIQEQVQSRSPIDLTIPFFIALAATPATICLIMISIGTHKKHIKHMFTAPKQVIEYSLDKHTEKQTLLFYTISYLLTILILFLFLLVPAENFITSIPAIGENLGLILKEISINLTTLTNSVFSFSTGLSLVIGPEFHWQVLFLMVIISIGPAIMTLLHYFRIQEKKNLSIVAKLNLQNQGIKANEKYPGTTTITIFIFISIFLLLEKLNSSFQDFPHFTMEGTLVMLFFPLIGLGVFVFLHEFLPLNKLSS